MTLDQALAELLAPTHTGQLWRDGLMWVGCVIGAGWVWVVSLWWKGTR